MTPTEKERRFSRIYAIGCLACRKRGWWNCAEVHHQNMGEHAGGERLGDDFTVGLCCFHHRGVPLSPLSIVQCRRILGPSMEEEPVAFRRAFGSDEQLLNWQNELIADAESVIVGRAA